MPLLDDEPDEARFQQWYGQRAGALGLDPNPDDPRHQYDYRAAFQAGAEPDPASKHWPSQFKRPGHPNRYVDGVDTITGQPQQARGLLDDEAPPQRQPFQITDLVRKVGQDAQAVALERGPTIGDVAGMGANVFLGGSLQDPQGRARQSAEEFTGLPGRVGQFAVENPRQAAAMGAAMLPSVGLGIATGGASIPVQLGAQAAAGVIGEGARQLVAGEPTDARLLGPAGLANAIPISGKPGMAALKGGGVSVLDLFTRTLVQEGRVPSPDEIEQAFSIGGAVTGGATAGAQALQGYTGRLDAARQVIRQNEADVAGGTPLGDQPAPGRPGQDIPTPLAGMFDDEVPLQGAPPPVPNLAPRPEAPPAQQFPTAGAMPPDSPAAALRINPEAPNAGPAWALQMADGRVVSDPDVRMHAELIEKYGLNPGEVASAGFMTPNGYKATRAQEQSGPTSEMAEALGLAGPAKGILDDESGPVAAPLPPAAEVPAPLPPAQPEQAGAAPGVVASVSDPGGFEAGQRAYFQSLQDRVSGVDKTSPPMTAADYAMWTKLGEQYGTPVRDVPPRTSAKLADVLGRGEVAPGATQATEAQPVVPRSLDDGAASGEAISRLAGEKNGGVEYEVVDIRSGRSYPLAPTVDRVDLQPRLTEAIVIRRPGKPDEVHLGANVTPGQWGRYVARQQAPKSPTVAALLKRGKKGADAPLTRLTHRDGRGLLDRSAWDLSKLTDAEELKLPELLDFGLEQPKGVPTGSKFYFTAEGMQKHKELVRLINKASRSGGLVKEARALDAEPIWKSQDGQVALPDDAPAPSAEARARESLRAGGTIDQQVAAAPAAADPVAPNPRNMSTGNADLELTRTKEGRTAGRRSFAMRSADDQVEVIEERGGWQVVHEESGSSTTVGGKTTPAVRNTIGDGLSREDAIDVAERYLRGQPTGVAKTPAERGAAIAPDTAPVSPTVVFNRGWEKDNPLVESPTHLSDGHSLYVKSALADGGEKLRKRSTGPAKDWKADLIDKIYADVVKKGARATLLGFLEGRGVSGVNPVAIIQTAKNALVGVNAYKFKLMAKLTGFDEIVALDAELPAPVVFRKDGQVVGVIMPIRLPEIEVASGAKSPAPKAGKGIWSKITEERGSIPVGGQKVADLFARGKKLVSTLREEGRREGLEALDAEMSARRRRPFPGAVGARDLGPGAQVAPGTDRTQPATLGRMSSTDPDSLAPSIVRGDVDNVLNQVAGINRDDVEWARRGKVPVRLTQMRADELAAEWARRIGEDAEVAGRLRQRGQAPNAEEMLAMLHVADRFGGRAVRTAAIAERTGALSDTFRAMADAATSTAVVLQAAGGASELGRALNILRQAAASPAGAQNAAIRRAVKYFGGTDALKEIVTRIRLFRPEEIDQLNRYMASVVPARWGDKALAYYYFSLLLNAPGRIVDFLSTGLFSGRRIGDRYLAAPIDRALSAARGTPRTRWAADATADLVGHYMGVRDGVRVALRTLITQTPSEGFSRFNEVQSASRPFKSELANTVAAFPRSVIESSDDFWKTVTHSGFLYGEASRIARMEGRTGQALVDRMAEIIEDPRAIDGLFDRARFEKYYRTFQDPLGPFGNKVLSWLNAEVPDNPYVPILAGLRPLRFVVPFFRTTVKLQKAGLADVARVPALAMRAAAGRLPKDQGELADLLARSAVSSMIAGSAIALVAEGLYSGGGPLDPKANEALRSTGWKPNAVRFGDDQVEYRRLEPFGTTFGVIADLYDGWPVLEEEESANRISNYVSGILGNVATATIKQGINAPYVKGISDFYDAIREPNRYLSAFINSQTAAFIPGIVGQVARATDPVVRQPRTLADTLKARIPGLSDEVPALVDVWGRDVRRKGSAWEVLLSPFPRQELFQDVASQAIRELGWKPGSPQRFLRLGGERVDLPPQLFDRFRRRVGEVAQEQVTISVESGAWEQLNEAQKRALLTRIWKNARRAGKAEILPDAVELLDAED